MPTCACGCGEKTGLTSGSKGTKCVKGQFFRFVKDEENFKPEFAKFVRYHERLTLPYNYKPTAEERQALLASCLGDGYLAPPYKSANPKPRLTWNMGNKEHALYKYNFFENWSKSYTEKPNRGWGSTTYSVTLKGHPVLKELYKELYPSGKKEVTKKWLEELNEVGWAWLYGDDGHFCEQSGCCFLHTEGYGEDVSQMFADAVNKFLNVNSGAVVFSYKGGMPVKDRYAVKMNGVTSDEFIKRIKEHMANGLEYKVRGNNINRRIKLDREGL